MLHIYLLGVFVAVFLIQREFRKTRKPAPSPSVLAAENIVPVDADWKWDSQPPLPIRPFVNKRNFHPSMGIRNLAKNPEQWLLIENTYLKQTRLRQKYTREYPTKTVHYHNGPKTTEAVCEFYDLVVNFLLKRFPQYFVDTQKGTVHNLITKEHFPRSSLGQKASELMGLLAYLIEEDFIILLKDHPEDPEDDYLARAAITGFPAGFDPSHYHNKPISYIHNSVPEYKERLKSPMHNFFNKLESKDLWIRHNWSIQAHSNHFSLDMNHAREGQKIEELEASQMDFDNGCFLRCERQCLTRLPKSRADIMTVRTYLTPMSQIKEEGLGPDLIRGIDLLPEQVAFYKKRSQWGKAVKEYLST